MPKVRNEVRPDRKATREAAQRKKRRNSLLWRAAGVLIVLGAAGAYYRSYTQRQLLVETVTTASYPAGLHMAGRISYLESPPIGGAHNVVWQNCGIYDAPIHNEHAVHSMEHGAVWITYRPDLPPDRVQSLRTLASDDYMLLSPYPGLAGQVVASAWNHQIRLDDAADPRLKGFIARYKNNPETTPEFGASCAGGTSASAAGDTLNGTGGGMVR
ncbi:MAG TPA: DUF3105 domain-containing protein [Vicinamibacterales bacterium]|nr:DUF3105 domain-containing protein [Vicinamibacterales bacterium]